MNDHDEEIHAAAPAFALGDVLHERNRAIYRAGMQAQVFLLPAFENPEARAASLLECAILLRLAIAPAVRAADDRLAFRLLSLAQELEAEGSAAVCKSRCAELEVPGGLAS